MLKNTPRKILALPEILCRKTGLLGEDRGEKFWDLV